MRRMMLKGLYAILLPLFGIFGATNAHAMRYRLPIDVYDTEEMLRPTRKLPAAEVLSVTNMFGGGHFNAEEIEFRFNADGTYARVGSRSVDLLNESRHAWSNCDKELQGQFIMNHLINGSFMKRIDNQAMNEMVARNYIPAEHKLDYMEGSHDLAPEQMVYLETANWLSVAELKSYFNGRIVWSRIGEVDAPAGLTEKQVREMAEAGDPQIRLKLRRATLRLVAGQSFANGRMSQYGLPFMSSSPYRVNFNESPMTFELGRASQIPGLEGEATQLASLAAVIAAVQMQGVPVYGFPLGFPIDETKVFLQSLDTKHTAIYKRTLGILPVDADPKLYVSSVARLIDHTRGQLKHKTLNDLALIFARSLDRDEPRWPDYRYAALWINLYRQAHIQLADLSVKGFEMHTPIILRTPRSRADIAIRTRIENTPNDIHRLADVMLPVLRQTADYRLNLPFGTGFEDFSNPDVVWNLYPEDFLVSGFKAGAAADPLYVQKVLFALLKDLNANFFKDADHLLFSSKHAVLVGQFAGLPGVKVENGYYRISFGDLRRLAGENPELVKSNDHKLFWSGRWYREWLFKHLPGI